MSIDPPELTKEQIEYIKTQQKKATALVSDPTSPYYELDEAKKRTASRALMRKWERERT